MDDGGEERERKEKENEEEKKNRFDELWAGFKNDVGAATKTKPIATLSKETKVHEIYNEACYYNSNAHIWC